MARRGRPPAEGIYRRLTVRMHGDERYMRLSPVLPSGQSMWIYLITGPHTGPIPGVFVAGRAAMAEALNWSAEDFAKAFGEVLREGLAEFDERTRLCFIPNAIRHNIPANPNVIKSWRAALLQLPECDMRARIFLHLEEALTEVSEAFGKAFREACGKAFEKASPKDSGKQETGTGTASGAEETSFGEFWTIWPPGTRKAAKAKCAEVWKAKRLDGQAKEILAHVAAMARSDEWTREKGKYVPAPLTYLRGCKWDGADLDTIAPAMNGHRGPVLDSDHQFGTEVH